MKTMLVSQNEPNQFDKEEFGDGRNSGSRH